LCLHRGAYYIPISFAEGAGTLAVTFKYFDNVGDQPLENAYVYLHEESKMPHLTN
jgi:hypothetical protein